MARHQKARGHNTKLSITQSFFELQTPDFAWKFVWTVQPNYKSTEEMITQSVLS